MSARFRSPGSFVPAIPLNHRRSQIGNAELLSGHPVIQVRGQGSGLSALSA